MLFSLNGKISHKGKNFIVVENNGLGYQVFVALTWLVDLKIGQDVKLFLQHCVGEDKEDLYGVRSLDELELFAALDAVSGVGPKSVLGILAIANVDEIRKSIAAGDPTLLTKVSGIGRKTAERIIVELRGKISDVTGGGEGGDGEVIDALVSLGYSVAQAREAVGQAPKDGEVGERLKAALKVLGARY